MPLILLNIFKNLFNYPSILRIIIVIIMNEESETQSGITQLVFELWPVSKWNYYTYCLPERSTLAVFSKHALEHLHNAKCDLLSGIKDSNNETQ